MKHPRRNDAARLLALFQVFTSKRFLHLQPVYTFFTNRTNVYMSSDLDSSSLSDQ